MKNIKVNGIVIAENNMGDFDKMLTDAANKFKTLFMENIEFPPEPTSNNNITIQPVNTIDNLRI